MNIDYYNAAALAVHNTARSKGWHDLEPDDAAFNTRAVVLITCEVAELVESYRNKTLYAPCDKPIELNQMEEELADIAIRVLDHMARMKRTLVPTPSVHNIAPDSSFMDYMLAFQMRAMFLHDAQVADHLAFLALLEVFAEKNNVKLARAIEIKNAYNQTRPYLHGNKIA